MSCLCSSGNKTFLFVHNKLRYSPFRDGGCPLTNFTEHITNLTSEDYEIIRSCKPATSQGHRIGLVYNWNTNINPNCSQNLVNPYYWGVLRGKNRTCVNGSPLTTAINKPSNPRCQLATILPGSSKNTFYNLRWTLCEEAHPYICRQHKQTPNGIPACEPVVATSTHTTATTMTTADVNNNTIIIAAATSSALFLTLLILVCLCCYSFASKRKNKNGLSHDCQREHYKQVFN